MSYVNVSDMGMARERRKNIQEQLLKKYNQPLISFTLNIPGPEKDCSLYRRIHKYGVKKIEELFHQHISEVKSFNENTGPEAYFSIDLSPEFIKEQTINLEENSREGRIFDLDVIKTNGKAISRTEMSYKPRKCLLCDENAVICSRSRKHTVNELVSEIHRLANCLYDEQLQ